MQKRYSISPITVSEIKSGLFSYHSKAKVKFEKEESFIFENEFFKVELKGYKLNQLHKDILDIAIYFGNNSFDGKFQGNYIMRTFSLYEIQKHLNYKTKNNNYWLIEKIRELQQTLIILHDKKKKETWSFPIIETFKFSEKLNTYAIIFHPLYYTFFSSNISIDYKELVQEILNLKHGITKAVIRYLITHKEGININIDKILDFVGVRGSKRNIEYQRKILLEELKEIKSKFNIELIKTTSDKRKNNDYTISYKRLKKVKFYYPPTSTN
jgi:hypothetical protein